MMGRLATTALLLMLAGCSTSSTSSTSSTKSSSGSGSSSGGMPSNTSCDVTTNGTHTCYTWCGSELDSSEQSTVTSQCTMQLGGRVVSSCDTSGRIGICDLNDGCPLFYACYITYYSDAQSNENSCLSVSGANWEDGGLDSPWCVCGTYLNHNGNISCSLPDASAD